MAVKIRLRRVGAKKQPSYRLVVADSRSPRDGRFIEIIGFYNPRTKPTTITVDAEKARKWLANGARPTESAASVLYRAGIVDLRSPRFKESGKKEAPIAEPVQVAAPTAPAAEAAVEAEAPVETVEAAAPETVAVEETGPEADATTES